MDENLDLPQRTIIPGVIIQVVQKLMMSSRRGLMKQGEKLVGNQVSSRNTLTL